MAMPPRGALLSFVVTMYARGIGGAAPKDPHDVLHGVHEEPYSTSVFRKARHSEQGHLDEVVQLSVDILAQLVVFIDIGMYSKIEKAKKGINCLRNLEIFSLCLKAISSQVSYQNLVSMLV